MPLSLTIPEDITARLHKLAKRTGQSEAACVINLVQEYLDDIDDYAIAERRYARIKAGKSELIPLSDLMKQYGLDD